MNLAARPLRDHQAIAALLDTMRPYCPVAVQDEADKTIAALRLPVGVIRLVKDEDDDEDPGERMLCCPKCNEPTSEEDSYFEDMTASRHVTEQKDDGTRVCIDGYYTTEGGDEDTVNPRIYCGGCDTEYLIPDETETEFF